MHYTRPSMYRDSLKLWAAAGLVCGAARVAVSAGRAASAVAKRRWHGLALSRSSGRFCLPRIQQRPRPLRRSFLLAYVCGVLWYMGNCYWIRDTMRHYGDMPPLAPELLLLGFSLVLGLYFGLFGLGVALVRRASGSTRLALAAAPVFWAALELVAARITSVPWDQLGYSQVDNALVNQLAPWTGVYGISFVLVAVNALIAGGLVLQRSERRWSWGISRRAADDRRVGGTTSLTAEARRFGNGSACSAESRREWRQ